MTTPAEATRRARWRRGWAGFAVFVAAFAVRAACLAELRDHSYLGNVRVSDASEYFQLANRILAGTAPFTPFWQAPLYPYLLAGFQALAGDSLVAAQWLHVAIGSLDCAILFALGKALFGRRVAAVTAAFAVLYAPFWLFDVQPLPATWTTLFTLLSLATYLRFRATERRAWLAGAGVLLGAALLTHGLAIFAVPVFASDLALRASESARPHPRRASTLAVFLAATSLLPAAVSLRNSIAAGSPVFVSHNAGINLYIGNRPDLDDTLTRRSGYEWESFFEEPHRRGITSAAALDRYFAGEALAAWRDAPLALLRTTARKALITVSGNETKRNFPIDPLREDSRLLRLFLWQVEALGRVAVAFPTGVVLPLAFLGFAAVRRGRFDGRVSSRDASLPAWIACALAAGMVVFFPASRYRVTAVALSLPYAAVAAVAAWDALARRRRPSLRTGVAFAFTWVFVNAVATQAYRHPDRDRAEDLYYEARWAMQRTARTSDPRLEAALEARATEAMRIDPTYPEPVELLAAFYMTRDLPRARVLFDRFSEMVPADAEGRVLLERILRRLEQQG